MRQLLNRQLQLGQIGVSAIRFDLDSRDDIPQILRGLQAIYEDRETRDAILQLLDDGLPKEVSRTTGRPGMDHWSTLVLGSLRLGLNGDYDRIHELANEHRTLRQMLGHGWLDEEKRYGRTTIRDNVSRLTPEVLERVNRAVVRRGHRALGEEDSVLRGRCDSYVVETDVESPTDMGLLVTAIQLILRECGAAQGLEIPGVTGWRQRAYQFKEVRQLWRTTQKRRRSNSSNERLASLCKQAMLEAYGALLSRGQERVDRARLSLDAIEHAGAEHSALKESLSLHLRDAERQMDPIRRRVLEGERIPHEEKVFSLHERHTEWISKGQAGVPVELGVRVAIVEDQFGFCLTHRVMRGESDQQIAHTFIRDAQMLDPKLRACRFDKGFWSPENRLCLEALLDEVALPKKGRWGQADRARESTDEFIAMRRQHPAVESAIHALEVHGLDRCPDHGLDGFKRYVAWGVVGRNLTKLGTILLEQERMRRNAERRRRAA